MKAWPFLFSANSERDYSPVTIPNFIKESGATRELYLACNNANLHEAGEAVYIKGYNKAAGGVVDLLFRVVRGTERMLGQDSDAVLTDKFKRPIYLYEGVVLTDRLPDSKLQFSQSQLDSAHSVLKNDFQRFWKSGIQWDHAVSHSLELPPATGESLKLRMVNSPNLPASPLPHSSASPKANATRNIEPIEQKVRSAYQPSRKPDLDVAPNLAKESKSVFNKKIVFCIVTGVALGAAYMAYRHFSKPKPHSQTFTDRVQHKYAAAQETPSDTQLTR